MTLTDALAAALERATDSDSYLWRDPPAVAFRAALVAALADELAGHRYGHDPEGIYGEWCGCEEWNGKTPWHEHAAAAIVAAMLPEERP